MANKRRRKPHRNPIAPPVHSAPGVAAGHVPANAPPPRPVGAEPPVPGAEPIAAPSRPAPPKRKPVRRRKKRSRTPFVLTGIVVLIVGGIVANQIINRRATSQFNAIAEDAGCSSINNTSDSGAGAHLAEGEKATYEESPPTHGEHSTTTVPAGVYDEAFGTDPEDQPSLYQSVHSLEHGAVIIWHDKLPEKQLDDLTTEYSNENKVIVVPFPKLSGKTHLAMSAWGRSVTCEKFSSEVIDAFIDRFREARSAPEPKNPI